MSLTAAQRSHLGTLCVDLRDIRYALAQHLHRDLKAVLVLPAGRLVPGALYLVLTVRYRKQIRAQCTFNLDVIFLISHFDISLITEDVIFLISCA